MGSLHEYFDLQPIFVRLLVSFDGAEKMDQYAQATGRAWFQGVGAARVLFGGWLLDVFYSVREWGGVCNL